MTKGSAGYDLYAPKVTLFPKSVTAISAELRLAIPKGYLGKIYPISGLLREFFGSCDDGIIDQYFRGKVVVLMTNHNSGYRTVNIGDRITQVVLHKKINVQFKNVDDPTLLGETARGRGGFGSTGTN